MNQFCFLTMLLKSQELNLVRFFMTLLIISHLTLHNDEIIAKILKNY